MRKEIFLGEKRIVYYEKGKGFPFIIIHGWGGRVNPASNLKLQDLLARRGFKVFLIELPGFGESSLPTLKTKNDDFIDCILEFCKELGIKQCLVYGHCFGGFIAVKLTKLYPGMIKGLVLCGVPSPKLINFITKFRFFGFIVFLAIAELLRFLMPPIYFFKTIRNWAKEQLGFYKKGRGRMWRASEKLMLKDFDKTFDSLNKVQTPTLIVMGSKENPCVKSGCQFFRKFPNSVIRIIPTVGHSLQIEAPEKLTEEIVNFSRAIKII